MKPVVQIFYSCRTDLPDANQGSFFYLFALLLITFSPGGESLQSMVSRQDSQLISEEINYCEEIKKLRVEMDCLRKRVQDLKANNNQGFEKDIDPRHRYGHNLRYYYDCWLSHVRVEDGFNARLMVDGEGQEDEDLYIYWSYQSIFLSDWLFGLLISVGSNPNFRKHNFLLSMIMILGTLCPSRALSAQSLPASRPPCLICA